MLRNMKMILLVGLAICLASRADASQLVVNGGFEIGNLTGWTVSGDGISLDTSFPNSGCCDAAFAATSNDPTPGQLSQQISTTPGGTYNLSFALLDEAGSSADSFTVTFGGFSQTITGDNAAPPGNLPSFYTQESLNVPGADITGLLTNLIFQGTNASLADWNLDDVSLVAATPIPPSLLLFATAMVLWLGLIVMRRRSFSF